VQTTLADGPFLTQVSCDADGCLAVGAFTFRGGSRVLSWSGVGAPQALDASHFQAGGSQDAVAVACGHWGCVLGGGNAAQQGFVLTTVLAAAVVPSRQPWVADLIPTFQEVSWRAADVARSIFVALALLFVIGFPAQIFNSTLMAHYEEVLGWFERPRRVLERLHGNVGFRLRTSENATSAWFLAAVFVLGGLFGALLDPRAGLDQVTLESFAGILLATAFTTVVYTLVRAVALHRATSLRGRMRVYGLGVAIAAGCLVVSRLTAAQPGYLYGILLGYDLGRTVQLKRHHEGRIVAVAAAVVLVVSVLVWLLWTPISASARADPSSFVLGTISTAMAAVFLSGLTSLMFGLLPLRWLDGGKLFAWRRLIWALATGVGLFMFVHVVLRNAASAAQPTHSLVVTVGLFVLFGVLSMGFWAYFRFRTRSAPQSEISLVGSVVLTTKAPPTPPQPDAQQQSFPAE
jgi:hypothetical protein